MHRIIKPFILIAIAAMPFVTRGQKHYEGPGNWFMGIDAGVTLAMNENVTTSNFFHTELPSGSISLGRSLSPYWAMRLSAGFYSQLGHPHEKAVSYDSDIYNDYRFHTAIGSLDLMLNLSNLFRQYDVRNWFDAYLIAGGGVLYSFGMDKKVDDWPAYVYPVNSEELLTWNAKTGIMGAWHVNRGCDLTFEIDCFFTDNAYNGVVDIETRLFDLFLSPRIGIVYYIKNSKGRHRYANPPKKHRYWRDLNN